jgi:hypothetical protein
LAERLGSLSERAATRRSEQESRKRALVMEQAARRRRTLATAVLGGLLLLGLALGVALERAETFARHALIDQTLRSNDAMMQLASAAISDKLEDAIQLVTEEASNPALRDLLAQMDVTDGAATRTLRDTLQRHLDRVLLGAERPWFQSWAVSDREAWVWARSPYDPLVVGRNYKYREWFNGQAELPRDAPVEARPRTVIGFSLAFASTAQNHPLLIGLAAPVIDPADGTNPHGRIVGVLNAGIHLATLNSWLQIAENRPGDGSCPDRFILLLHRAQLIRHPCPAANAAPLPVAGFSDNPEVRKLLDARGRRTATFLDPLRATPGVKAKPSLAVAGSPASLPDWTLILEQDVDAALRPITALTVDFHWPAHMAFALGGGAFVLLVALLWWGARWPRER